MIPRPRVHRAAILGLSLLGTAVLWSGGPLLGGALNLAAALYGAWLLGYEQGRALPQRCDGCGGPAPFIVRARVVCPRCLAAQTPRSPVH